MLEVVGCTMPSEIKDQFMEFEKRRGQQKVSVESNVCRPTQEERLFGGKVLNVNRYHYKIPDGAEKTREGIQHVRKSPTQQPDNLCTIGVLKRQIMCDCLVLVKQYRAPLKGYTLEFPATVFDHQRTFEDVIAREVEDETGYSSTDIKHVSPETALDPDVSDGKVKLVSLLIDGDDPLQHPAPRNTNDMRENGNGKNGHGHIVDVLQVPVNGLLDRLKEYSDQGLIIDSRVYAFAIGLKKGEKMALSKNFPEVENQY